MKHYKKSQRLCKMLQKEEQKQNSYKDIFKKKKEKLKYQRIKQKMN